MDFIFANKIISLIVTQAKVGNYFHLAIKHTLGVSIYVSGTDKNKEANVSLKTNAKSSLNKYRLPMGILDKLLMLPTVRVFRPLCIAGRCSDYQCTQFLHFPNWQIKQKRR